MKYPEIEQNFANSALDFAFMVEVEIFKMKASISNMRLSMLDKCHGKPNYQETKPAS